MELQDDIREQVGEDMLARLASNRVEGGANAYIYADVVAPGTKLQELGQEIEVVTPSALVVVDLMPDRGWAHPCEWHLYDADSGAHGRDVKANLPPDLMVREPAKFVALNAPVVPIDSAARRSSERTVEPARNALPAFPGQRFAVLFSGVSSNSSLNDLEFLYRTLLDVYGFEPDHVFVLNYDGTVNYHGGPQPVQRWPGDNTAYRLKVNGPGTRAEMRSTLSTIAGLIKQDDLLLIHTNGAGRAPGDGVGDYCICAYSPYGWEEYYVNDFAADIGDFVRDPQTGSAFDALMAMMAHSFSIGFVMPVLDKSAAASTHVCGTLYTLKAADFDLFAEDWIAGLSGHYPNGTGLQQPADTTADGRISAAEAFAYAEAIRHDGNQMQAADRPPGVGQYLFLGLPSHDLFLRDNLSDQGIEPLAGGGISASPDIIVYNQELKDPAATLLTPAARMSDTLGEPVEAGQDNFVYLRVQNRGETSTPGTAKVYWSPASTLPSPAAWHLIGEASIPPVKPSEMAAIGPIVWPQQDIPAVGHYCFIGLIDSGGDPAPNPASIKTIDDYYRFIRQSNNATWRNFNVQDMFKDSDATLSFHIQGWPRQALAADLLIDLTALPRTATVALRILKRLGSVARVENASVEAESALWRRYRLTAGAVAALRGMPLQPSEQTVATLEITVPEHIDAGAYRISVAQLVADQEMGRVTTQLGIGDHPYLANRRSCEVHRTDCVWARRVAPNHRQAFSDLNRAIKHGYNGCRYCLPEQDTDVARA